MKRRKALQYLGFGVTGGLILPSFMSSCSSAPDPKPEVDYDGVVGIIGAGASGLYAADILRSKGIKVKIFEASNRLGGRVRALTKFDQPSPALLFDSDQYPVSDFPLELGAAEINGTDSLWASFIDQSGVPKVLYSSLSSDHFIIDGSIKNATDLTSDSDFTTAQNFFNELSSYSGPDVSVQQAIQSSGLNTRVQAILNSWIGNKHGSSNSRLSIISIANDLQLVTHDHARFIPGKNHSHEILTSAFDKVLSKVTFNTVVKNVTYNGEKIILSGEKKNTSGSEPFTAQVDKVIITVPVSVLKNGTITFSPSLPAEKVTSLSKIEMDASIRVILEFKKNFWGTDTGFIYGGSQGPEYFNAGIGRSDFSRTISVTINGSKAEELSGMGEDMIPVLLEELDAVYDGQASLNVRRNTEDDRILSVIMDWSKEEFIAGGTSYIKAGGTSADRATLAEPVEQKLFFAGEATDVSGDAGTMSGALRSAERVSTEVLNSIISL